MFKNIKTKEDLLNEQLTAKKQELISKVNPMRDEKLKKGFPYKGFHIQSDNGSKGNLAGYLLLKDTLKFPFGWRTYENIEIQLKDFDELFNLSVMMGNYILETMQWSWAVKDKIENAVTMEDLNDIFN